MSKTIFITGTSSGLGRQTALLFAKRGWSVQRRIRAGGPARGSVGRAAGLHGQRAELGVEGFRAAMRAHFFGS